MQNPLSSSITPFPSTVEIEGIAVTGFPNPESLFERIVQETQKTHQTVVHYLNIHVANTAFGHGPLRQILRNSDLVYCDGAGIVWGSKMLGTPLPTRLTAADWFLDMLAYFARKQRTVYLLGGAPGVPDATLDVILRQVPYHTVLGAHHGYILDKPELEQQVIQEINALAPDIVIVGFGTPLQECWIEQHRYQLRVPVIYAIGAVMDFASGRVSRCPQWMGKAGFEWLYRLYTEPGRLLGRYVVGNPWFLSRIALKVLLSTVADLLSVGAKRPIPSE